MNTTSTGNPHNVDTVFFCTKIDEYYGGNLNTVVRVINLTNNNDSIPNNNDVNTSKFELDMPTNINITWNSSYENYYVQLNEISDTSFIYGLGFEGFRKIQSNSINKIKTKYDGCFVFNTNGSVGADGCGGRTYIYTDEGELKYMEFYCGWISTTWWVLIET